VEFTHAAAASRSWTLATVTSPTKKQTQAVHDLPFAARLILPAVPADAVGADGVGRPQRLRVDDRRRPRAAAGVHCWQITF